MVNFTFLSDVGKVRKLNEDYVSFYEGNDFCLYIVADGMGGCEDPESGRDALDCPPSSA